MSRLWLGNTGTEQIYYTKSFYRVTQRQYISLQDVASLYTHLKLKCFVTSYRTSISTSRCFNKDTRLGEWIKWAPDVPLLISPYTLSEKAHL